MKNGDWGMGTIPNPHISYQIIIYKSYKKLNSDKNIYLSSNKRMINNIRSYYLIKDKILDFFPQIYNIKNI